MKFINLFGCVLAIIALVTNVYVDEWKDVGIAFVLLVFFFVQAQKTRR